MGSIYTQMLLKALAAGAPPQTPISEGVSRPVEGALPQGERLRRLPVWHAEGKGAPIPISAPGGINPRYATGWGAALIPAGGAYKTASPSPQTLCYRRKMREVSRKIWVVWSLGAGWTNCKQDLAGIDEPF